MVDLNDTAAPGQPGAGAMEMSAEEALAFSARLEAEDRHADAERVLRTLIGAGGLLPIAHNRLGALLFARGERFEALYHFGRALVADRRYVPALANRGTLLAELGHHAEALADLRLCTHLDPKNAISWNALGNVLMRDGEISEALVAIDRTLFLAPDNPVAHFNRGCVLARLGREEQAITEFDRVVAANPDFADAYYNRAVAKLALGRPEAFFEYEARFKSTEAIYQIPSKAARWDGGSLKGKTILVWAEQGLGDTIMFMRYLGPIITEHRPARVLLYVHKQLRTLCQNDADDHFPEVTVLESDKDLPEHDVQHPLMSSPVYFPQMAEPWSPREGSFNCPDCNRWGGLIGDNLTKSPALRVGLCWAGNPMQRNDRNRSIPLRLFGDLLGVQGVQYYSLQKDVRPSDQEAFDPLPAGIIPGNFFVDLAPRLTDMRQTAHAIGWLDIVITVDTAVAHLAASMGAETWVLLCDVPHWPYGRTEASTPWYPSMQLFRRSNGWRSLIRQVRSRLVSRAPALNQRRTA